MIRINEIRSGCGRKHLFIRARQSLALPAPISHRLTFQKAADLAEARVHSLARDKTGANRAAAGLASSPTNSGTAA
jgi:hypothetical protein